MATLSYRQSGLTLKQGGAGATDRQIRDLQRDLRRLGYLRRGIDGDFGEQTELAVRGLQHDLLRNARAGKDGAPPVRLTDYNQNRVATVTGQCDQALAECISDMLDDALLPKLPSSANPAQENGTIVAQIAAMPSSSVPTPFLLAVLKQESDLKHFNEPKAGDEDTYITVGLDRNVKDQPHIITSRGYGAGQYTLFHHPPQPAEVHDFMLDVGKNLQKAITELKDKFDHFVNGHASATQADDRLAEFGTGPLRRCKFDPTDPRFLNACKQCLVDAGRQDIQKGVTPVYQGSSLVFSPTDYYQMDGAVYRGVPMRPTIGCDWPYAVRRYNGSGINSYHYQVRVLRHLLTL